MSFQTVLSMTTWGSGLRSEAFGWTEESGLLANDKIKMILELTRIKLIVLKILGRERLCTL